MTFILAVAIVILAIAQIISAKDKDKSWLAIRRLAEKLGYRVTRSCGNIDPLSWYGQSVTNDSIIALEKNAREADNKLASRIDNLAKALGFEFHDEEQTTTTRKAGYVKKEEVAKKPAKRKPGRPRKF